ncbi:hypothetical protein G7Y89_g6097 [Cudoniella acicularis]|uniref:Fungal N-terminal domain-containing protein n=1 Tax=Cudoniella acicularis TaxID=354080 RepID=A0A8H4W367_9HELO|nr:hypothetical protein G7Y89_g6097 [Cudoniella acicularis]
MDPFSITTGVVGLLGTCVSVVKALNDFCASVATVDTKITGLREIVQDFVQVLTLMKDTLEQEETKSSLNSTGHINNHWSHISTSIKDGQKIAPQLENLLEKVDGNAAVLIRVRKHGRLESAAPQILVYQQQIQHCSDTMQLSMQAVIM